MLNVFNLSTHLKKTYRLNPKKINVKRKDRIKIRAEIMEINKIDKKFVLHKINGIHKLPERLHLASVGRREKLQCTISGIKRRHHKISSRFRKRYK